MLSDEFFAAEAILRGEHRPIIEVVSNERKGFLNLPHFRGHDGEIAIRNLCRPRRSPKRNMKFVFATDTQSVAVERTRMLLAADKSPNLRHPR
jgi:hypothetical protein